MELTGLPTDGIEGEIQTFEDAIWHSPETCNECFTRIRVVDRRESALAATSVRNRPAAHHERTEHATAEWPGFADDDPIDRYGVTFCGECGADGRRWSDTKSLDELTAQAKNLAEYTLRATPYDVDCGVMGETLGQLKRRDDLQGRDAQILAVAWARGVQAARRSSPDDAPGAPA
jgi:hypothetical protein